MFGQVSVGRTYPGYTTQLGGSIMFGKIVGGGTADSTSEFLKGGSAQGIIVFPVIPFVGAGGGVNHSYTELAHQVQVHHLRDMGMR
jgi:hypothetical protein